MFLKWLLNFVASSYVQNSSTPWPWTSNFKRTTTSQLITNQLKEDISQGWLLYVIRTFLQVVFHLTFLGIYSSGKIKVISTVVEGKYTPDRTRQICFAYQLNGFYMIRGFTEWYFLKYYSYVLENLFYFVNAPDFCFKRSLPRIFCVNSSVNVLSPQYEGPLTHLFCTSSLCTFIVYKKKEIGFVATFFLKYLFELKVIPNYMSP